MQMTRAAEQGRRNRSAGRRSAALAAAAVGAALLVGAAGLMLSIDTGASSATRTNLSLQALDGGTIRLADYRGKTVALNFWATWCPPCRAEMPELNRYFLDHRDQGFVLVAVNTGETPELARGFIRENGFTFPVALDPDSRIADRFGITGLPVTLIIGPEGEIIYRHTGLITLDVLDAQVRPLLEG